MSFSSHSLAESTPPHEADTRQTKCEQRERRGFGDARRRRGGEKGGLEPTDDLRAIIVYGTEIADGVDADGSKSRVPHCRVTSLCRNISATCGGFARPERVIHRQEIAPATQNSHAPNSVTPNEVKAAASAVAASTLVAEPNVNRVKSGESYSVVLNVTLYSVPSTNTPLIPVGSAVRPSKVGSPRAELLTPMSAKARNSRTRDLMKMPLMTRAAQVPS